MKPAGARRQSILKSMRFDEKEIRPDIRLVLEAAAILDITEWDLFHLAYRRWHGSRADDELMEPFFVAYMFGKVVPVWVRHFSRLVERLDTRGELDASKLGVKYLPRSRHMASRGMRYAVTIGLVMFALIVFAEFASQLLRLSERCMFPPCY
jgi:hypothetical protein